MKRGPARQSQSDRRGSGSAFKGAPKSAIPQGRGNQVTQLARGKGKPSDYGSSNLR